MTKEHKENLAVVTACVMLLFGIILTAAGFVIDPTGEVHDSVLWILGQSLVYAGSIFGVAAYMRGVVDKRMSEWEDRHISHKHSDDDIENDEQTDN